jgi:dTDP-4-amino-4,6-dideoxygalactose transaminase
VIHRIRLHKTNFEKKALLSVYNNQQWVVGNDTKKMEQTLCKLFQKKYCVLTSNGFASLFISIKSLNLKNEYIYLPETSSCFAMVNAIISSGNIPVFLKTSPNTGNICFEKIKISELKSKYIIYPNHAGITFDLGFFKKHNYIIIEDCAQSFISSSQKKSDATIQTFSFYPTKTINGIDGGAILTNDVDVLKQAKKLVYYDEQLKFDGGERYNFRLSNIHAAVFNVNVLRLEKTKNKILTIYDAYKMALNEKLQIHEGTVLTDVLSKFVLICESQTQKKQIIAMSKKFDIQLSEVYISTSDKKLSKEGNKVKDLTLQIPFYEDLNSDEIKTVCEFLRAI